MGIRETEKQAKNRPFSLTYSNNGNMIGVACLDDSSPKTFAIRLHNANSGECIHSCSFDGWFAGIWTHEGSFRFAAILPDWRVAVYEIASIPGDDHCSVAETFIIPDDLNPTKPFLFYPVLHRVSYFSGDFVTIWDAQGRDFPLHAEGADLRKSAMSFSPDGCFFACGTVGSDIWLWRDCPGGYKFHRKLTSSTISPTPLFSPDNGSVITWDRSTIQLWPPEDAVTSTPNGALRTSGQRHPFILEFSPGEGSAAFARLRDNVVTVIDPRSGARRLVIDAGMEVYGLKVSDSTVMVEGRAKLVIWDLPKGGGVSDSMGTVEDSVRTTTFKTLMYCKPKFNSISPDLRMIAESAPDTKVESSVR